MARYPNDPIVLGLAARFEQARGNNERASAFWRAAIAAMPPGSGIKSLDYGLAMPPGTNYRTPGPGDTKHLLDPNADPSIAPNVAPSVEQLAPLPSYKPQTSTQAPVPAPASAGDRDFQRSASASAQHRPHFQPAENCVFESAVDRQSSTPAH